MNKPRAFWFHYNKPESRKRNRPVLTIHYKDQCILVENIECYVNVKTRVRKSQPYCVLAGKGVIHIKNGTAYIYNS